MGRQAVCHLDEPLECSTGRLATSHRMLSVLSGTSTAVDVDGVAPRNPAVARGTHSTAPCTALRRCPHHMPRTPLSPTAMLAFPTQKDANSRSAPHIIAHKICSSRRHPHGERLLIIASRTIRTRGQLKARRELLLTRHGWGQLGNRVTSTAQWLRVSTQWKSPSHGLRAGSAGLRTPVVV